MPPTGFGKALRCQKIQEKYTRFVTQACLKHCLRNVKTELLKLHCARESPGPFLKQIPIGWSSWRLGPCVSHKLLGAAGTTPGAVRAKDSTQSLQPGHLLQGKGKAAWSQTLLDADSARLRGCFVWRTAFAHRKNRPSFTGEGN